MFLKKAKVILLILCFFFPSTLLAESGNPDFNGSASSLNGPTSQPADQTKAQQEVDEELGKTEDISKQRDAYLAAARLAEKAKAANNLLSNVWAGTATVCWAGCVFQILCEFPVTSILSVGSACAAATATGMVCGASSLGSGILDLVKNQDIASATLAMTTAIGQGVGWGISFGMQSARLYTMSGNHPLLSGKATSGGSTANWLSCVQAAIATIYMIVKNDARHHNQLIYASNKKKADALISTTTAPLETVSVSGAQLSSGARARGGLSSTKANPSSFEALQTDANMACGKTTSLGAVGECARALDGNLPKSWNDPNFSKKFKDVTKTDLNDFFEKSSKDPMGAIGGAIANAFGKPDRAAAIAGLLNSKKGELMRTLGPKIASLSSSAGGYSGGGGSGRSAPNFGSSFASFGKSLFGNKNRSTSSGSAFLVHFKEPDAKLFHYHHPDYFLRIDQKANLFNVISSRYRKENKTWKSNTSAF